MWHTVIAGRSLIQIELSFSSFPWMLTYLLLSTKVPEERRAATRYGVRVAVRLEWGELCGKGIKEQKGC